MTGASFSGAAAVLIHVQFESEVRGFGIRSRNSVQLEDPGSVAFVPALWLYAPRSLLE